MGQLSVIAVDWSGARKTNLKSGIWLAAIQAGELVESRAFAKRDDVIAYVRDFEPPFVAGFDFSFGLPEWFARDQGCTTIDEVWDLAEERGDEWLLPNPTPPFWSDRCNVPLEQRFRRSETRYPAAKSVFQLVGVGMVGPGSVRGMPHLGKLRSAGVAIWPFDDAADRTAIEVYPSLLRKLAPHHDVGVWNEHERDAVVSARVMWDERETVAALRAATDPTIRLEGDIWAPTPPQM